MFVTSREKVVVFTYNKILASGIERGLESISIKGPFGSFFGTFQMMLNSSSLLSFFVSCCHPQERESNIKFFVLHFSASAPLQGTWSLWSPWSSCNQDCLQHRRRACNNRQTLVSNSVSKILCRGDERESSNCHGDLCNEGMEIFPILARKIQVVLKNETTYRVEQN